MPGGAYSALSGMRTRLEELDRIAADLANLNTPGYKIERAGTFASQRGAFDAALDSAVDVVPGIPVIDFRSGAVVSTGRDLDVAIDGRGFLVVDTPAGPRYTRNGSLTRNAEGVLTTMQGEEVQGQGGPIRLGPGPVAIDPDGSIRSGTAVVGQLQIVDFENATDLAREGGSRFRAIPGATPQPVDTPKVLPGSLEESNASVIDLMVKLTEVTRGFESLQKGVTTLQTELDSRAISELPKR